MSFVVNMNDNTCPFCKTPNSVDTGIPQIDGPDFWVENECSACQKTWQDYYDPIEEYASKCAVCGSPDIIGGKPQIDGPDGWCYVECMGCGNVWKECYKYSESEES